ncbi:MAG: sulfotransferase [Desulfobacterales bacterium]
MATLNHTPRPYTDLIVICGHPRSGTTWLNRELFKSPNFFSFLLECTLITQQIELYSRTLHYCELQRFHAYFSNQQNLLYYYRINITKLVDQVAILNKRTNYSTLVLKDPYLCLYLNDIKDVPPHKLIILIRDLRDVLASMKIATLKKTNMECQEGGKGIS